jgi:hypothetical protein
VRRYTRGRFYLPRGVLVVSGEEVAGLGALEKELELSLMGRAGEDGTRDLYVATRHLPNGTNERVRVTLDLFLRFFAMAVDGQDSTPTYQVAFIDLGRGDTLLERHFATLLVERGVFYNIRDGLYVHQREVWAKG